MTVRTGTTMTDTAALLADAAQRSAAYLDSLGSRAILPTPGAIEAAAAIDQPLQDDPLDPALVLDELDRLGSPAAVASAGPRYFGFVVGGTLPATLGANMLATAWDQNVGMQVGGPFCTRLELVVQGWLTNLLGLPSGTQVGFVTGATMANLTGLAAARHALLARAGWDVEARGLFGAPEVTVVAGGEVHVSVLKALTLLGMGRERVVRVPVDGQGRMRLDELPEPGPMTIVCVQAGNVNTGAFDPIDAVATRVAGTGAWLHVDGAFGLWAAASPALRPLTTGIARADSIATDGHKWLNVPYDCGLAFVRERAHLNAAMAATAAYLVKGDARDPHWFGPEMSRRARVVEVWAALRSLGRRGVAEMIERNCRQARRFAEGLAAAGFEVLNDVVLNQVLVSFGSPERTLAVIRAIQEDGTCWCGGTVWQGRTAMRISVSCWSTTDADVELSLAAMLAAARRA